jgi:hypothetical protein
LSKNSEKWVSACLQVSRAETIRQLADKMPYSSLEKIDKDN